MATTERKVDRNLELIAKRDADPVKWSWAALAEHYRFSSRTTAANIYRRTKVWLKGGSELSTD